MPAVSVISKAAVPLTASAALAGQVTASIAAVRSITVQAIGPGEIAGPGVAVTVRIVNRSSRPVSVDSVSVTLLDGSGAQALPSTGSPAAPLSGSLAAGKQAQGVYVFTISQSRRNSIKVLVSDSNSATDVTFVGNAT